MTPRGYRWYSSTDLDGPRRSGMRLRTHAFLENHEQPLCGANLTLGAAEVFWKLDRNPNALRCRECLRRIARRGLPEVLTS